MEFHYVDLRCFRYATENREHVREALDHYLPPETTMEVEETEGHYGDPIEVYSVRLENMDEVRYVMNRVLELPDIRDVETELESRVDEDCSFHLRLDKQAAYNDRVERGDGISLRAKVEAYPAKHGKAVEAVRRSLFDSE